jgi:cytochrome c553
MHARALLILLIVVPLASAQEQALPPDHAAKMAKGLALFKSSIRPLLEERCLKCHGGKSIESEFDLSDRDSLLKGGLNGKAIEPGKSAASRLIKLVRHQQEPNMPKGGSKLSDGAINQLAAWIDLGAPYDQPLVAAKKAKIAWTQKVLPEEAKTFWSFQPLKRPAPPAVKDAAWCQTDIDRFLLAAMEKAGLSPNPAATKTQLIRRAYFDVIGLPPNPDEVDAFLKDNAPDAWPKLIDKLLASPHYGERWARHWLDLARFAESHGFEHDYDRPTAYHYRDFVIEALNRDLPYNTFVRWQIAGDEYEPDNHLAQKATGFLAAGVHSTQITKSEAEKHRYDELDDKLHTVGTAMLGLTIGCARCHDHKFDPIPARDYYRMLSTFTGTVRSEQELNVDPEGYRKAKAAFDREHEPYERALKDYEANELSAKFAAWETASVGKIQLGWDLVEVKELKSKEGAVLRSQPDGSIVALDKNPAFDAYTIVAKTSRETIASVRLEALPHGSLPKQGPGRARNGNFALSDIKVVATSIGDPNAKPIVLKLINPRADFEQKGLPVAAAVDGDAKSAWAVDGQIGKPHAALFDVAEPTGFPGGAKLTFTLSFNTNADHQLGRLRLSVRETPGTRDFFGTSIADADRVAMQTPAAQRTPAQTSALLRWYRPLDDSWQKLEDRRQLHLAAAPKPTLVKALIASEGVPAVRLHTQGDDLLPNTHFLRRGDVDNKEGIAEPSYLQVLMPSADAQSRWLKAAPPGSRSPWKRRALAEWITDVDQGAGHLLARVIVNRLWQHHLGRGLVATPSDFGTRGERPTHPELLDHLARRLIDDRWSLKALHKYILTSAAYQQSSTIDEARAKIDRDNKLVWRYPARRLEAEVIRDTLLAAGGELDLKPFGPGTLDENSKRRSIYFTVKRSRLMPMMVIFDAPEALGGQAERPTTTIAPQALHLMNNATMRRAAKGMAARLGDGADLKDAVERAYRLALARPPSPEERDDSVAFVRQQMATYPEATARPQALVDFCHVLMCLNEFVYVE